MWHATWCPVNRYADGPCNCGLDSDRYIPPEPPTGTWVRDRHGGVHVRIEDGEGNVGWAAGSNGFYAFGKWEAMWRGRGPLVECGPWGRELEPASTDGNPELWR